MIMYYKKKKYYVCTVMMSYSQKPSYRTDPEVIIMPKLSKLLFFLFYRFYVESMIKINENIKIENV